MQVMKQYILVKNSNNREVQRKAKLHFFKVTHLYDNCQLDEFVGK